MPLHCFARFLWSIRPPVRVSGVVVLLLLLLGNPGPVAANPTTGTLILSFRDSRSGAAVVPSGVMIDGVNADAEVDSAGLLSILLGGGQHQVRVNAEGYESLDATVTVDGDDTPVNTIELDRETSPTVEGELEPVDFRVAGLEGYAVDAAMGSLIPGVAIEIPARDSAARTDAGGYFSLEVAVPSAHEDGPSVAERVTVTASKEGFVTEERRNVEIISGTTMTVSIQLDRLTSESETLVRVIDEGHHAPRLHSWRFDVVFD